VIIVHVGTRESPVAIVIKSEVNSKRISVTMMAQKSLEMNPHQQALAKLRRRPSGRRCNEWGVRETWE
jgi:hypothetical protein